MLHAIFLKNMTWIMFGLANQRGLTEGKVRKETVHRASVSHSVFVCLFIYLFVYLFIYCLSVFLGPYPQHTEVPRPGIQWEP